MEFNRKEHDKRFEAMKNEASSWLTAWKDIQTYLAPTRGQFSQNPNEGKTIDHKTILDGTQIRDLRTLASGMTSGLTSPSRPWFKLGLQDDDLMAYEPVSLWLGAVQERMMAVFAKSNIYGAFYNIYEEVAGFGTGALAIVEDYKDVVRGVNYTCGEYYLSIGPDGRANGFGREYWQTVGNIVDEFGEENCSDRVRAMYSRKELDQWVQLRHLIQVNREYREGELGEFPFSSCYWEYGANGNKALKSSGFEDFPIMGPRWSVTSTSSIYGKGPGFDALGDIRMLQKLQKDKMIGLDKLVNPPIQADGTIEGNINILPGGITRYSATTPNAGVKPVYQVNIDLASLQQAILETQGAIGRTFFRDLFLMLAQAGKANMTATEVVQRHEEKLLMLGPVLEKLENELLDPAIDRTFNIMSRLGLIPPAPRELQGQNLKIEYISMLAQAQKMVGTTAIEQALGFVGNIAGARPEVTDVIDFDEAALEYCRLLGINPKITRSKEEIAQIRKAMAQAQAQAQQQQNLAAAVQGAKTLSETNLEGKNALSVLTGGA